ncbi:hypothetical protein FQA39_LY14841 [Lamprigera yunnana]|nr:hypothetical protein FQA39_LY14841 [Lamprigera yunnana]
MAFLRFVLKGAHLCVWATQQEVTVRGIKRWVAPTLREIERRRKKMDLLSPQPRSTYLEWNYDAELYAFGKRIGEVFDSNLLRQAFVHRSHIIQCEIKGVAIDNFEDNSELIAEGEKLISNCIKTKFQTHLTEAVDAIHNYLMSTDMLAHVASHMGVTDIILSADFPVETATKANTFKAVVAALHRSNVERTNLFINDFLLCHLNGKDMYDVWDLKDPYGILLKLSKQKGIAEIEFRLCNQSATNTILANYQRFPHNTNFTTGWGESVDIAKDTAALDAIRKFNKI